MTKPLITIIVPVYKVENYIHTCVESIINQSYTNWELILVNDGSPDKCPLICDEYAKHDKRVSVIHLENGGQSRARNRALDIPSNSEYITFLDSDDFWHKDYLEIMLGLCVEHNADMSQCSFIRGTGFDFPHINVMPQIEVMDNHSIFLSGRSNVLVWGKMYKRKLFDNIRMPEGLYNEDDWVAWKLYYKANRIVVSSDMLYYYRVNQASTMNRIVQQARLDFVGGYHERIAFFENTGEMDLRDVSIKQYCKSILMYYGIDNQKKADRDVLWSDFRKYWPLIKGSQYVSFYYQVLFAFFRCAPGPVSYLSRFYRKKKIKRLSKVVR